MMDYMKFAEKLVEGIKNLEAAKGLEIRLEKEADEDIIYIGVGKQETRILYMRVFVQRVYEEYQNTGSMEKVLSKIEMSICNPDKDVIEDSLHNLKDYEKAKNNLMIRAISSEVAGEQLDQMIYKKVGDIILAVYYAVHVQDGHLMSIRIVKSFAQHWGISEEAIWNIAMEQSAKREEPRLYYMEQLIFNPNYKGETFMNMDGDVVLGENMFGYCISTADKINGATAIFYPTVAQRLSDLLGGKDLYLVFTSAHEVMVHTIGSVDLEKLIEIQESMQSEVTEKEDRLSKVIYMYSRENDCITVAA